MQKKNNFIINGVVMAALFVFLTVRFITGGFMAAHVLILVIVLLLSLFQFYLYFKFFGKNDKND